MRTNTNNLKIQNLEAEGLRIVDKRGLSFKTSEERFIEFENERLVSSYLEMIHNGDADFTKEEVKAYVDDFKIKMGIA